MKRDTVSMKTRKVKAATKDHEHVGVYEYMRYVIRLREEVKTVRNNERWREAKES